MQKCEKEVTENGTDSKNPLVSLFLELFLPHACWKGSRLHITFWVLQAEDHSGKQFTAQL